MKKLILIILLLPLLLKAQVVPSNYSGNSFSAKSFMNSPSYKVNGVAQTFSQWTTSTTKIYYNTGNVGIGTASPSYALDVVGTINATNLYKNGAIFSYNTSLTGSPSVDNAINTLSIIFFRTSGSGRWSLGKLANTESGGNAGADFGIYRYNDAGAVIDRPFYLKRSSGYLGLGTETPTYRLDVNGSINGTAYYLNGVAKNFSQWTVSGSDIYYSTGAVGIGVAPSAGATLSVKADPPLIRLTRTTGGNEFEIGMNTSDNLVISATLPTQYTVINNRLGVGVSPSYKLDVNGVINSSSYIQQQGIYAEIYVNDASTAQSIANGITYTKSTAFTSNGDSQNCTPDATNDKITITKTGRYIVSGYCSFTSGTNLVVWKSAIFMGGAEQSKIHWSRKVGTGSDVGSASFGGIINASQVPVDIDVRFRHDQAGAVDLTVVYSNITVNYIGE